LVETNALRGRGEVALREHRVAAAAAAAAAADSSAAILREHRITAAAATNTRAVMVADADRLLLEMVAVRRKLMSMTAERDDAEKTMGEFPKL
jgi:regulator of extracellular matrix RemA (YlzA/DUF370 family)